MGFYNRLLVQPVAKFVDLLGKVEPLDVVSYGGALKVTATKAAAGTVAVLPTPATGFAYRLHRGAYSLGTGATAMELLGHTAGFIYSVYETSGGFADPDNFNGQIVTEALDVLFVAGGGTFYLTYDVITTPSIT